MCLQMLTCVGAFFFVAWLSARANTTERTLVLNRESSVGWLCKLSDADLCTSVIGRRLEQLTLHFVGSELQR